MGDAGNAVALPMSTTVDFSSLSLLLSPSMSAQAPQAARMHVVMTGHTKE
jgi:hypothetical protein